MATKIQLRRDTAVNWTSTDPVLSQGEAGVEIDTGKLKIGNGIDSWSELTYVGATGGGTASTGYGYSLDEATRVYTKLGAAGKVVHDKIRQCVQNDDGTVNYFLDPANGWDKENYKPSRRFADPDQAGEEVNTVVSVNAFRETVAGQGISNRRGEYAVITNVMNPSSVEIDEIAPVHKVYGASTTTTQDHLIDNINLFTNVNVGDTVHNRSTGQKAKVTVVGAGDLTLDADIFQNETPGEFYSIYAPFLANNEEFLIHTAVVDGTDGQVMVYIPKFYYKYAYATGVHSWMVIDTLEDGYEVHPAFVVDGEEVDFITIGAFEAWQDGEESAKLYSVVGKLPSTNFTRAQFRTMAQARSAAHSQLLYYQHWAVQVLYITYFGNWDSQSIIGKAMTYFGSGGAGSFGFGQINNGNYAVTRTGISLKNGLITVSEYADTYDPIAYMSLFGIENVYGNLLKWVDGINVEQFTRKIYLCNTPADLADDTNTGYDDMGITYEPNLDEDDGFPLTLENTSKGLIPATFDVMNAALIPDWIGFYSSEEESWRVACSGGGSDDGSNAGVAYLFAGYDSSDAYGYIGARLCFSGVIGGLQ